MSDEEIREYLPRCRAIARNRSRGKPYLFDEAHSVAVAWLAHVVRTYDPSKGRFRPYADLCVGQAVSGYIKSERPKGQGGPHCKPLDPAARVVPFSSLPGGAPTHPSAEPPVGWEAEYQDEVEWLASRLPPRHAEAFRLRFLHADDRGAHGSAERMGIKDMRFRELVREAAAMLGGQPCRACLTA